jgi:hypothetical protein
MPGGRRSTHGRRDFHGRYLWQAAHGVKNLVGDVYNEGVGGYAYDYFKCAGCDEKHYCGKLAYASMTDCGLREQNMGKFTVVYCKRCHTTIGTYANCPS